MMETQIVADTVETVYSGYSEVPSDKLETIYSTQDESQS